MNNRSSGRRRGRGGRSSNRGPNDGNRQQNRSPGNAHQLCEKYKSMARDAHQQGDRVMNEYYLQFADHYFRVLTEFNAKKEEQRKEREDARQSNRKQNDGDDDGDHRKADKHAHDDGDQNEKPVKKRQPRSTKKSEANGAGDSDGEKIEADRLPGAIAIDASDDDGAGKANGKSPVKRTRRTTPKTDDGEGASAEAS